MPTKATQKLRNTRKRTHGDWDEGAAISEGTIALWEKSPNWKQLRPGQTASLRMIAHKVHRILTGDPDLKDSWDDIAGYAHLGIPKGERSK